jgi:hypothetical protein
MATGQQNQMPSMDPSSPGAASGAPLSPEELHAKLQQENAQMRAAGAKLQQQCATLQAENQRLAAMAQAAAASAASSPSLGSSRSVSDGMAPLKLKAPTLAQFSGTGGMGFQVDTWLRNVKKQFDWYGSATFSSDAKKIAFATLHMEGAALEWWDSLEDKDAITAWDDFVKRLHQRYRPKLAAEVARQGLASLRQTGTVSQLCNRMLSLLTHVSTMHEEDKIFTFKRALNDQLAAKVAEKEPSSLDEAMHIAVLAEQYLTRGKHGGSFPFHGRFVSGRGAGGSGSASTATAMEINNIDWTDETELMAHLRAERDVPASTPHGSTEAGGTQLLAMMQELRAQQHALAAAFQKRGANTNTKGAGRSAGTKVPGVTKEEFERCRKEGLCLKCKEAGHLARDCTKSVQPLKW